MAAWIYNRSDLEQTAGAIKEEQHQETATTKRATARTRTHGKSMADETKAYRALEQRRRVDRHTADGRTSRGA